MLKVESTLVPIPVSVIDAKGRAITDLKLEDFQLMIDGKPAQISEITRSESPIRLAMLFDNSSSVVIAREFEKDAAVKFFKRVVRPDKDQAALFSVADRTQLEQPLTRETSQLVRAIEAFPSARGSDRFLDGIITVADYLRDVDGRRVIVIVSDGEDTISDPDTTLEMVVRRLQLANCQVYVVKTKDFENFKRTGVRVRQCQHPRPRRRTPNAGDRTQTRRAGSIRRSTRTSSMSPLTTSQPNSPTSTSSAITPKTTTDKRGEFRNITVMVKRPDVSVRTGKVIMSEEDNAQPHMLHTTLETNSSSTSNTSAMSARTRCGIIASDLEQFRDHLFKIEKRDDFPVERHRPADHPRVDGEPARRS